MTQAVEPQPVSRLARKRNKKMRDILRATTDVLREKGYDGISLEEVADRLDLTKASLYHYFNSKEELLTSCLDDVAEDASKRMAAVLEEYADAPAATRLAKLICEHVIIITLDYPHVSELFTRRLRWPRAYRAQVKRMRSEHDKISQDAINDGIESGEFTVPAWFTPRSERQIRELCGRLTAVLLRMLQV